MVDNVYHVINVSWLGHYMILKFLVASEVIILYHSFYQANDNKTLKAKEDCEKNKLILHWRLCFSWSMQSAIKSMKVEWKVHRLTMMMQWSNLTKCGLFFNIVSSAVHTLLPSVLQHWDSRGYRSSQSILIPEKVLNCSYDIIGPILLPNQVFFFSCWGTENSQMVPSQENMEGNQPILSHSTAAFASLELCATALSWWNRTHFVSFPGRSRNVSSTTFQSPELLIRCGFIWKEAMQLVSGEVEFTACQVSLLWHNTFLVRLYELSAHPRKLYEIYSSWLCMSI